MTLTSGFRPFLSRLAKPWPWLLLALTAGMAVWHDVDFPDDPDDEYPQVTRPTFSRRPPPAYRLAEPGDTIDHIAIYCASGGVVLSLAGLLRSWRARQDAGLWLTALALSGAALWHSATPGPSLDGWHTLGWRAIANPAAPTATRSFLLLAAVCLAGLALGPLWSRRALFRGLWAQARARGCVGLLLAAAVLVILRQFELPGVEPAGYWPRWAFVLGVLAFDFALIRLQPRAAWRMAQPAAPLGEPQPRPRLLKLTRSLAAVSAVVVAWFALVEASLWLSWYHRPIARLRTAVAGKIYMCAMPTYEGLELAYARHPFKTILNLFPEDTPFRSPRLPEELRFAREHRIRYVGSPASVAESDAFLTQTLQIAQDPKSWPILVHCHGCVDRTPAWVGIYRFIVEGVPLAEVMRQIEQHRGYRPKATVILLYNRVLAPRAPVRYAQDPTAMLLQQCAHGITDDFGPVPSSAAWTAARGIARARDAQVEAFPGPAEGSTANPEPPKRVSRRDAPPATRRRPSGPAPAASDNGPRTPGGGQRSLPQPPTLTLPGGSLE